MASRETPTHHSLAGVSALLAALVALTLLPGLAYLDFHYEEARRVIPAREMLASGNFSLPTLWGQVYLNKPPGHFWLLASSFQLFGFSEFAARLPSVVAVLCTSLALAWVAARHLSLRAGLFAGALFALSFETLSKGRLAEIEAHLACLVFLSVALWWMGRAGSWLATLGSGLALAGALLLKGPVSLVFFFGPPLAIAWNSRSPRSLASARTLVPLGLGLLLAGLWPLILFQSLNSEEVLGLWGGQLNKDEGHGLAGFAMERLEFVVGSLLAFAPASLILLPALGTPLWRRLRREPALAIAWQATLAGGICLLLFPGTNVRYFFPGLPFIALAAGRLLDAALEDAGSAGFPRRLEAWAKGLAWFSLAGCLVILVGFFTPIDGVSFNLVGLALGATLVFFALGVLRGKDSAARLCTAFLVLPLLIGQIVISQSAEAAARRHNNKRPAAEIQAALPRGESLTVGFRGAFNTFAYLRAPVHYTDDWRSLEKEAWLLLTDEQFATIGGAEDGVAWQYEQILRVRLRRGERVLLRIWP